MENTPSEGKEFIAAGVNTGDSFFGFENRGESNLTPAELELLQGMRNCYSVCHANFEDTIEMVGGARGLEPEEVKQILNHIKENYSGEKEYKELRAQLPEEFPF